MTNAINRRAFLRSAASASAVAAGAGAVTIAAAGGHPDAELIALGAEFDRLFPAMHLALAASARADKEFNEAYPGRKWDDNYLPAHADSEAGRLCDEYEAINDRVIEIANRVRELPPTSLLGLAVWARTLKLDLNVHCANPAPRSEWDWDEECLAGFIDQVERMAQAGRA